MSFWAIWGAGGLVVLAYVLIVWLASLYLEDASIMDIFWGPGFVLATLAYFALADDGLLARKLLVLVLVTVWGLRLALHIALRNAGRGEDYRYQRWREQHGDRYWWVSFFQVFLLQGALLWLISLPLLAAQYSTILGGLTAFDVLGALLWGLGFAFEAVGDWQLMQFKRDPAHQGQVMQSGLWAYTRHPNYFGEAVLWWGYYLIAASTGVGLLTIVSPLVMTYLLLRVSGVAMLERDMQARPGYADYARRTAAFVPRFPRRDA